MSDAQSIGPEWSGDDEKAWELALRHDVDALRDRAEALRRTRTGPSSYAAERAAAFALAAEGAEEDAISVLSLAHGDAPFPVVLALDLARIRFLGGHPEGALVALRVGLRGSVRLPKSARRLLAACVAESPWLWRSALRVVWSAGTPRERLAASWELLRARYGRADPEIGRKDRHMLVLLAVIILVLALGGGFFVHNVLFVLLLLLLLLVLLRGRL